MTELEQADTVLQLAPLEFTRTGSYSISSALNARGSGGYFWSGRSYSALLAYHLAFLSTSLRPQRSDARGTGRSVRCLAR